MNVLVDTSVWSLALRRHQGQMNDSQLAVVSGLTDLIRDHRVVLIGPVRQELLSGVRDDGAFASLQSHLVYFPDEQLQTADFENAARCFNRCRAAGIASSAVDMLICAVAIQRSLAIFTTDADFLRYASCLDVTLFDV